MKLKKVSEERHPENAGYKKGNCNAATSSVSEYDHESQEPYWSRLRHGDRTVQANCSCQPVLNKITSGLADFFQKFLYLTLTPVRATCTAWSTCGRAVTKKC